MDSSTNLTPAASEEFFGEFKARRSERQRVDADTELQPSQSCTIEVSIRDLSPCGFMAECPMPVQIGSYVSLDVPGIGLVDAQVRWQIGLRLGGMFLDPISLSQCEWTAVKAA